MRFDRWLRVLCFAASLAALPGLAHAVDDHQQPSKPKDAPPSPPPPQTMTPINVLGVPIQDPPMSIGVISYGGVAAAGVSDGVFTYKPNNKKTTANKKEDPNGCKGREGDPVVISSGAKVATYPLFSSPGEMGLGYSLYYTSDYAPKQWRDSLDYSLDLYCGLSNPNISCNQVTVYRPDGSGIPFSGARTAYGNHPEIGGGGLATLTHNSDGTWTVHDEDATTQVYDSYGQLVSIKDAAGIGWSLATSRTTIAPYTTQTTVTVTHTDGQKMTVVKQYDSENEIMNVTVTDPAGNQYQYREDGWNTGDGVYIFNVVTLYMPGASYMTFGYNSSHLLSDVGYNGAPYWKTSYDANGHVIEDGAADGSQTTSFEYAFSSGGMTATITNPLGHTTADTYTADAEGYYMLSSLSETAVMDCGSTVASRSYDANDNLTKTVDANGVTHLYSYAINGQLQTETEAYGTTVARKIDYVWDSDQQFNRLLSVTVEGESRTSYTYNAQNRLASVTRTDLTSVGGANTLTTTYAYTLYANGMVRSMTVTAPSPNGTDKVTTNYDAFGNVTSVVDGLGHATTYSNYSGLGEPGKIVGPNGDETDYTYDARGRVATKTTHPNSTTATWSYTYDGFGLLSQISAPDGEVTTWNRDAEMRITSVTHNDKDGTSTESFTYDANGDVTSDVIARGSDIGKSTTYVYDGLGRVYQRKGADGQVLTYAYDGNGNVLSVTDALGHKTSYQYDALNRITKMVDANGGITQYAYDAGDHLTKVIDPRGLVTTYSYDGLGLLWSQSSPDTGTTTFSYDAYGRLAYKIRADGIPDYIGYDALNRVTSTGTTAYGSQSFTYDSCTNGKGRLCSVSDGHTTTSYSYSPQGWVQGRGFTVDGSTYSLGYAYDSMGRLATVNYPDGNQALYYYTDGAVSKVDLQVGSYLVIGVSGITYRPMDAAMSNWKSYNGLVNTINYDHDLRPTSISVPGVQSLSFTYDTADRITKITNGMDATMTQTLGYDPLNRLTSVSSGAENESYTYDADGNRLSQIVNGVSTTFAPDSGSNRLLSRSSGGTTVNYSYDPQGDMVSYGDGTQAQMFYYNSFTRLDNSVIGGISTNFDVNPEGQRLRKYTSSTSTYFAPDVSGNLLAEKINGTWYDYVWLNGRMVEVIANGGVFSLHDDQTGRPQVMTEPNGTSIDWAAQNKPFDRTVTTNAWGPFNIGFPGQYNDTEVGDYWYNGARDYSPGLGRYLESDPVGLQGGTNTYAYVGNNPISNIDPFGLCKCQDAGNAPSPQQYQAVGQDLKTISMLGGAVGVGFNLGALTEFRRGGVLDAQRYGGSPAYANYAFGVEMSANGASLGATLGAANAYGALRSSYPAGVPMDPNYPSIPASNVANITQGYNDQQNGTLCTSGGG